MNCEALIHYFVFNGAGALVDASCDFDHAREVLNRLSFDERPPKLEIVPDNQLYPLPF